MRTITHSSIISCWWRMATIFTVYHNPRCSKSRSALQLLREHGMTVHVINYVKTPLTATALTTLLNALGMSARALLRVDGPEYTQCHLDDEALSPAYLVNIMIEHPRLMQRPIVVMGSHAIVARPPEKVLELIDLCAQQAE